MEVDIGRYAAACTTPRRSALPYLEPMAREANVSFDFKRRLLYHNSRCGTARYDCLWAPRCRADSVVTDYAQQLAERCEEMNIRPHLFRSDDDSREETVFSTPQARQAVGRAFLRRGVQIIASCARPKVEMRPMGYEKLQSLGFGAIFITYRNIANNCPLVLWWGDPTASDRHPLSKWYPLFPRKANEPMGAYTRCDLEY